MGEKKEEYAFVGVCQKVPSLSLTLDGLGLKITIDFSGVGELEDDEEVIVKHERLFFSFIPSFFRSREK